METLCCSGSERSLLAKPWGGEYRYTSTRELQRKRSASRSPHSGALSRGFDGAVDDAAAVVDSDRELIVAI